MDRRWMARPQIEVGESSKYPKLTKYGCRNFEEIPQN